MLKKISGMATMYLRFMVQRSTILIGRAAMNCMSVTSVIKRTKPIRKKNGRITVRARSGGRANRYRSTRMMPGSSRMIGPKKLPKRTLKSSSGMCSMFSQNSCDRLTLLSGKTLCGSQYSNGPKKFQFGPRRNVQHDQRRPQDDEAEHEDRHGEP